MAYLNDNFLKLKAGYLFPEIGRRVKVFCDQNPEAAKRLIRCGIGDVTEPLPPAVIAALHKAVDEMAARETFKGYGPEQGYEWLRSAIGKNDFRDRGIEIADDEIFVSDGSKCDTGNILDILGAKNKIAISDPVYPVYVDTNVMAGHTGEANEAGAYAKLVYLPCKPANNFIPEPPKKHVDVIYLCSPNNPTGAAFNLRNSRRARVRHRIPQLLKERRFHRRALRLHGRSEIAQRADEKRRIQTAASTLESPHDDEVQRRELHCSARGGILVFARRQRASAVAHHPLSRQRGSFAQRREEGRAESVRRRERSIYLGAYAQRCYELAGIRQNFEQCERCHHARFRLRLEGRRLFPH